MQTLREAALLPVSVNATCCTCQHSQWCRGNTNVKHCYVTLVTLCLLPIIEINSVMFTLHSFTPSHTRAHREGKKKSLWMIIVSNILGKIKHGALHVTFWSLCPVPIKSPTSNAVDYAHCVFSPWPDEHFTSCGTVVEDYLQRTEHN